MEKDSNTNVMMVILMMETVVTQDVLLKKAGLVVEAHLQNLLYV